MKRNDLIKSMAGVFVLMLLVVRGEAQLVSCNGFLQGNYIEVGVNSLGAYGSSVAAPAGYHPRGGAGVFNTCTSTTPAFGTGLGFVADPDKDGWNVGTPNYIGDYFLPGTPYEGWEIAVNGSQANENNGASSSLGSITSVTNSGQVRSVVWDGSYSGLSIHQVTSFDIGNLYFTTNVTLTNTTGATISNIYYQRGVDPDNEEPLTGNYTTNNNIDYQLPNALGATLVSGTGLTYGAYLGLGTLDARAKAFIISNWPPTVALSSVYAGVSPFQYSGTTTADYGIGLVFNVGSLAPGASTTLTYVYILKGSDFLAALAATSANWTASGDTAFVHHSGDTANVCQFSTTTVTVNNPLGHTYTWSCLTGQTLSTTAGSSVSVATDTTLIQLVAIGTGTGVNDTVYINLNPVNATPSAPTAGSNGPVCQFGTLNLTASSSGTVTRYSWSGPSSFNSTLQNPSVTNVQPAAAGVYTVVAYNGACPSTGSTTAVTVNVAPTISAGSGAVVCNGSSTSLTATGGSTYTWSPAGSLSSTAGATVTATPTVATTYTVTGTDAIGCSNKATVTVAVNPLPIVSASASPSTICAAFSSTLTATSTNPGSSGYIVSSIPYSFVTQTSPTSVLAGVDDGNVAVALPFTFTYFGTNYSTINIGSNGYVELGSTSTNYVVTSFPSTSYPGAIALFLSDLQVVSPGSITYSTEGSAPNRKFVVRYNQVSPCCSVFSDSYDGEVVLYETSNIIDILVSKVVSGSHTCGIQNAAGTLATTAPGRNAASYSISTPEAWRFTNSQPSFTWSPATSLSSTTIAKPVAGPLSSTITYTVTATAANGCTNAAAVTVTVNPLPTVGFTGATTLCDGQSTALSGTGAASYSWSGGISNGVTFTPAPGTYSYTVTGTSAAGCTNTATATVVVNALPTVSASDASVCASASTTNTSVSLTGSPAGGSWSVSNPYSNATAGSYTGTYTYTDGNGCTNSTNNTITVYGAPAVTATTTNVSCNTANGGNHSDGTITTTVSGGSGSYSYTWTGGNGAAAGANPTGLTTATYSVTVTDGNGCSAAAAYFVDQNVSFNIPTISVTNISCNNANGGTHNNGTLTANPSSEYSGYTYAWSNGATTNPATSLIAAAYTVTVTNTYGCTATGSATVGQPSAISLAWTGSAPVYDAAHTGACGSHYFEFFGYDNSISATSSGGTGTLTYHWSTGATSTSGTLSVPTTGTAPSSYTVYVSDANGCSTGTISACVVDVRCSTPGNSTKTQLCRNGHTICVDDNAVAAQLASGATLGPCDSWRPQGKLSIGTEIKVYPNPTDGMLNVEMPAVNKTAVISIVDVTGRILEARNITDNNGTAMQFDLSGVAKGVYLVKIVAGDVPNVTKVIVK